MQAGWGRDANGLVAVQHELAAAEPPPWVPHAPVMTVGACFVCGPRPNRAGTQAGDPAWAGAALARNHRVEEVRVVRGSARAPYEPGLLALREGPVLRAAVLQLSRRPEVLLVNATGRDHPRRAGLALHLGAVLDLPTVGVTDRPLLATGPEPADVRGATSPLMIAGEVVGCRLRTRAGARSLAVNPAWRTDLEVAVRVVLASTRRARTPDPLRHARKAARRARASYSPSEASGLPYIENTSM
jgi:deoxyribonuclease V